MTDRCLLRFTFISLSSPVGTRRRTIHLVIEQTSDRRSDLVAIEG